MLRFNLIPAVKKYILRIAVAAVLTGIFFIFSSLHTFSLHKHTQPVTLSFSLPLQPEITEKYKISSYPRVEKVIIAGQFSDWNASDTNFSMRLEIDAMGTSNWVFPIHLQTGKTIYKYVVYLKGRDRPIWVHDKNAKIKVSDGFKGFNSVYLLRDYSNLWEICRFGALGTLGLLFLYSIFEFLLSFLLKKNIRTFHRNILFFFLLLFISNAGIIIFNINHQKKMSRLSYMESINLIHTFLLSRDIDFSHLDRSDTRTRLNDAIRKFFWIIDTKIQEPSYSSTELTLHQLAVFDTNLQLVTAGEKRLNTFNKTEKDYITNYSEDYFTDWTFGKMINNIRENPALGYSIQFGEMQRCTCAECQKKDNAFYRSASILNYNLIFAPIYHKMQIQGYYGLIIIPQLFSAQIVTSIWINIVWSTCLLLFSLIFFIARPPNLGFSQKSLDKFCKRYKITKREREIIEYIAKGTNYHKVADRLFISLKTVKAHIYNIYQKAEVNNRIELINYIRDNL